MHDRERAGPTFRREGFAPGLVPSKGAVVAVKERYSVRSHIILPGNLEKSINSDFPTNRFPGADHLPGEPVSRP